MRTSAGLPDRLSIRLKDFDYVDAIFFITICSNQRRCMFGEVETDHINLSAIGKVVERNWLATADLRPDVVLDEFIVMPNHFHAVLSVGKSQGEHADSANLGSVVRGFKGSVTSDVRRMLNNDRFDGWQRGYYDHVIRNA